jgi:hypothetical protein
MSTSKLDEPAIHVESMIPSAEVDLEDLDAASRKKSFTRGMVLALSAQWVILTGWCWHLYSSFDVHVDFAGLSMGWWGMIHAVWNPHITMWHHSFLADHFELISLPLSFLSILWPHDFWGFIIQNGFITMGEVAGILLVELFTQRPWWPSRLTEIKVKWMTLGLFLVNPWIFWAASDDVHFHAIGMAAAGMLVLYCALAQKWWWTVAATALCLSFGDVAGLFLFSVALSVLLVGWREWKFRIASGSLLFVGYGWIKFVARMGGSAGTNLHLHFGYLLGSSASKATAIDVAVALVKHPGLAMLHLVHAFGSLFGYVSAGGVFGLVSPLAGPMWLTLLEGGLGRKAGITFGSLSMSPWQMVGAAYMVGPCSVVAIGWLTSRTGGIGTWFRRHLRLVVGFVLVNALLWGAIWIPDEVHNMNLTPAATAEALDHVLALVPHENAVFGSWSVLGRFGERQYLHTFPLKIRVKEELGFRLNTPQVDFVVAPWTGLALEGPNQIGILGALRRDSEVKLVYHKSEVWLFSYNRKPGQNILYLNVSYANVPGSVLPYPTGQHPMVGLPGNRCLYSDQLGSGYLVSRLTQHLTLGSYRLSLDVDAQTPLVLEVRDDDTHRLLARSYDDVLPGRHFVNLPFDVTPMNFFHDPLFKGWWPYHFAQLPPLPEDTVEFRLWSPGGGMRSVCSLSLVEVTPGATKVPPV